MLLIRLEPVCNPLLVGTTETCWICAHVFELAAARVAVRQGEEGSRQLVGSVCPDCLTQRSRENFESVARRLAAVNAAYGQSPLSNATH